MRSRTINIVRLGFLNLRFLARGTMGAGRKAQTHSFRDLRRWYGRTIVLALTPRATIPCPDTLGTLLYKYVYIGTVLIVDSRSLAELRQSVFGSGTS
jgi:hypothetical protein